MHRGTRRRVIEPFIERPFHYSGLFFWDAGSTITANSATGFSFTGFAQVGFNNVPANFDIGAIAATGGTFLDQVTILPPSRVSGQAQLVIPMHVTGSASTVGAVTPGPTLGIQHTAEFQYSFTAFGSVLLGRSQDTIGLSTTGRRSCADPRHAGLLPYCSTRRGS